MTSALPEKKNKNIFNIIAAVCFAFCIILLGINLFLPVLFNGMGLPLTLNAIRIIIFAAESAALAVAVTALFKNNTGLLLYVPAFVLAGVYLCKAVISTAGVIRQLIAINEIGATGSPTFFSVALTGVLATFIMAVGVALAGVLCLIKQKQKNVKGFLYFAPSALMLGGTLINAMLVLVQIINTVVAITERYPRLAMISTVFSLVSVSITFAVYLLYTAGAALIGMNLAKKSAE